jgi:carbonic anhydrase
MSWISVVLDRGRTVRARRGSAHGAGAGASLTEAQRDSLTPDQVVQAFLDGNARFLSGRQRDRDFLPR